MKQLSIDMEFNKTDLDQIFNRISIIKEKIEIFRNLELWQSQVSSENSCEIDIVNFPVDFRMLLEAIGTGTLASDPPRYEAWHIMNIEMPYKFDSDDSDWYLECDGDVFFEHSHGGWNHRIEDIYLVGSDVDRSFYGYNTKKIPYEFVHQDGCI